MNHGAVAAVGAPELAGDGRSRDREVHKAGVVQRHVSSLNRPSRRLLDLNPHVRVPPASVLGADAPRARPCVEFAHTPPVQTPEPAPPFRPERRPRREQRPARAVPHAVGLDGRIAWVAGLVLTLSPFMDWYAATQPNGLTLSVTGWHTGALGKLVFFIGLATLILEALREAGIVLPASVPEQLVLAGLGGLAVIFVLIRLISVPDTYFAATGRGIGIYVALLAALALLAAGLLRSTEALP